MTDAGDRVTVDAIWRAADLTRAYLARERAVVEGILAGVDGGVLDGVLAWWSSTTTISSPRLVKLRFDGSTAADL
ncbi:hypothetical protein [Kitasatospora sp. NPDC057223]|uniref:hypothetical protein n=1 Tax=Kitasatospora sp. NPDC057223 TaxID=3346055 RepID=UPI00362D8C2B